MAEEKQLEILKQGVKVWNKWKNDNPYFGEVDLTKADLTDAVLIGADLIGANLSDAKLINSKLINAKLTNVKLMGAYLMRAKLIGVDLRVANLADAKLMGADLRKANLTRADLTEANFGKVDLTEANLTLANLVRTNLVQANLTEANLTEADFTEADFTESRMANTILVGNNLSGSLGLETVEHFAPSIMDTITIRQSKGKIPSEFLRGCGLSDLEIEQAKLASPDLDPEQVAQITYEIHRLYCDQPIQFYSCFISYNNKDQDFAQRLHDDLQNNGVRCWFAPEDMKIGDEFRKTIGQQIRLRDKLLVILSENSIQSEWVGDEVEKALAEEKEQGTLKLFPIRLDDAVLKSKDDWAEKIRLRRHIGDFSSNYEKAFEHLLRDLKAQ